MMAETKTKLKKAPKKRASRAKKPPAAKKKGEVAVIDASEVVAIDPAAKEMLVASDQMREGVLAIGRSIFGHAIEQDERLKLLKNRLGIIEEVLLDPERLKKLPHFQLMEMHDKLTQQFELSMRFCLKVQDMTNDQMRMQQLLNMLDEHRRRADEVDTPAIAESKPVVVDASLIESVKNAIQRKTAG